MSPGSTEKPGVGVNVCDPGPRSQVDAADPREVSGQPASPNQQASALARNFNKVERDQNRHWLLGC